MRDRGGAVTAALDVLYEDNHLVAAGKPPGLLTQSSGRDEDSLEERAREWVRVRRDKPGNVFLHAVHRLDRDVSGVVLFAVTGKALSRINEQMRQRRVRRVYHALVSGAPPAEAGRLEHWLAHRRHRAEVVAAGAPGARRCELTYRVLARRGGVSLLEVELETGRYHQIRAQLADAGCPILGDDRYGNREPGPAGGIGLHHRRLELEHPVRREPLVIEAPYPAGWPADLRDRVS